MWIFCCLQVIEEQYQHLESEAMSRAGRKATKFWAQCSGDKTWDLTTMNSHVSVRACIFKTACIGVVMQLALWNRIEWQESVVPRWFNGGHCWRNEELAYFCVTSEIQISLWYISACFSVVIDVFSEIQNTSKSTAQKGQKGNTHGIEFQ